eukprot:scaffold84256_cov66-Phaeocystis_antarctica.AAC.2
MMPAQLGAECVAVKLLWGEKKDNNRDSVAALWLRRFTCPRAPEKQTSAGAPPLAALAAGQRAPV